MDTICKLMQDHKTYVLLVLLNVEIVLVQLNAPHAFKDFIWILVVAKPVMEIPSKMEELV